MRLKLPTLDIRIAHSRKTILQRKSPCKSHEDKVIPRSSRILINSNEGPINISNSFDFSKTILPPSIPRERKKKRKHRSKISNIAIRGGGKYRNHRFSNVSDVRYELHRYVTRFRVVIAPKEFSGREEARFIGSLNRIYRIHRLIRCAARAPPYLHKPIIVQLGPRGI